MKCDVCGSAMVEQLVTYSLIYNDRLVVVENVPARVCRQCGEQTFDPDTVERLQRTIWEGRTPTRTVETPVFDLAAVR